MKSQQWMDLFKIQRNLLKSNENLRESHFLPAHPRSQLIWIHSTLLSSGALYRWCFIIPTTTNVQPMQWEIKVTTKKSCVSILCLKPKGRRGTPRSSLYRWRPVNARRLSTGFRLRSCNRPSVRKPWPWTPCAIFPLGVPSILHLAQPKR